jgi:uncharacterized membrane protein
MDAICAWDRLAVVLLALMMLSYLVIVGWMVLSRHRQFGSYAYDLGIYDQALWLISRGYRPYVTVRELHILGDHFTPILYPLAMLYRMPQPTANLLLFQTAALALGAWPLYRIGRRMPGSPGVGLLAAATYLLYPPLRGVNLFDFHPIALATPGVLFALDFAAERRMRPFLLACIWTLLCKQEAAAVVACLGLWYAARWKQPNALILMVGGAAWFFTALRVQAHFAGMDQSSYVELYSHLGDTPVEIMRMFLLTPWVPLLSLDAKETLSYLLLLLAPVALLPLRTPGLIWLLAFPLALNLFSNRYYMRQIHFQYTALLTPVLLAAATVALTRVPPRLPRHLAAAAWTLCTLLAALTVIPIEQRSTLNSTFSVEDAALTQAILADIPAHASVCATQNLVPHLAQRRRIYMFPNPFWPLATGPGRQALQQQRGDNHPPLDRPLIRQALMESEVDYLVLGYRLNIRSNPFPLLEWEHVPLLAEVLRAPTYGLIRSDAGIWVLKRGAAHEAGLRHLGLDPLDTTEQFEARVQNELVW